MGNTKSERYEQLLPQVESLVDGETDMIAKMANVAALLHSEFGFWWTVFYSVAQIMNCEFRNTNFNIQN